MGLLQGLGVRYELWKYATVTRLSTSLTEIDAASRQAGLLKISLLPDSLIVFRAEQRANIGQIGKDGGSTWVYFDARRLPGKDRIAEIRKELRALAQHYGGTLVYTTLGALRSVASSRRLYETSAEYPDINFDMVVNSAAHYGGKGIAITVSHRNPITGLETSENSLPPISFFKKLAVLG